MKNYVTKEMRESMKTYVEELYSKLETLISEEQELRTELNNTRDMIEHIKDDIKYLCEIFEIGRTFKHDGDSIKRVYYLKDDEN